MNPIGNWPSCMTELPTNLHIEKDVGTMSRWCGRFETCEFCGLTYEAFKTGLTFKEVRLLLWVGNPDYSTWKYKRRHTVLGLWHQMKLSLWREHLYVCEAFFDYESARYTMAEPPLLEDILEFIPSVPDELSDAYESLGSVEAYESVRIDGVPF